MRKVLLFLVFVFSCLYGVGQPTIVSPTFPNSVGLFDLFEVSFTMGDTYSNPYDPNEISIRAYFISPDNTVIPVEAFYYEGYSFQKIIMGNDYYESASDSPSDIGWRIRFTPTKPGTWFFKIKARDSNGVIAEMPNIGSKYYTFTCTSVSNGEGFISKANSRFLKRDVVKCGVRQYHSFFPIGPNVAWYSCKDYGTFKKPRGIYDYERYVDSLDGNANYMRVFLNRYQYLSLYGPEYTQLDGNGNPVVYFDNTINQKDSAELDCIIQYASQHGIAIMLNLFSFGDFRSYNSQEPTDPSIWGNNPFNGILDSPCEFFTDVDARAITKNLFRYIVSRWGYATNIMAWEFWNEVSNMFYMCDGNKHIEQDVGNWHEDMVNYLEVIDPFHHCITTSSGSNSLNSFLCSFLFDDLDVVQQHNYQNIQKAKSKEQLSYILYLKTIEAHLVYPSLPFFMGEFGFGQGQSIPSYVDKDPLGIDLHNSLWSSLFSTSIGPASFWWWNYLDSCGLFKRFSPLLRFCENLPILSDTFKPYQTGEVDGHKLVFENNSLEVYCMINSSEDTIYGWSQDTAFAYQSLRWLTDDVIPPGMPYALHFYDNGVFDPLGYVYTLNPSKRPQSSSDNNTIEIPITNQPIGNRYHVKWYDSETGLEYNNATNSYAIVQLNGQGEKVVSITFPSFIRNLQQHTISNTFGDAVFSLFLDYGSPTNNTKQQ